MAFKLLKTEYLKLKGNTSFKVFSIFFLVFLPGIIFTAPTFAKHGVMGFNSYPLLPRNYEVTWYFTSYLASWFSLFILAFVLIFHITNEFTYKTVRQNIIDGYSRSDFFKAKFYMLLAIAIISTIYVAIVGLGASLYFQTFSVAEGFDFSSILAAGGDLSGISDGYGDDSTKMIPVSFSDSVWTGSIAILSYFVQILAYLIFATFIAFSLKKGAVSVIVYLGSFLIELIIGAQFMSQDLAVISENLPLYSFSKVLPNPNITDLLMGLQSVDTLNTKYVILSLVYMALFLLLTRWIFGRRDVA